MYETMEDELLVSNAYNGDTMALDILMNRFKPLVRVRAKDYFLTGGDMEDLIQEGMIGLYKAVYGYDASKGVKFASFAALCVTRQIQTAIKADSRQKHMPLNTSLSLHTDTGQDIAETSATGHTANNPEDMLLVLESYQDIYTFLHKNLTDLEHDVLMHHIDGKTHLEIATHLNKNQKTVDNALQRIKRKLRAYGGVYGK